MTEFLQSPAWEQFQGSLGRQTFTNAGPGWHYLAIEERGTLNTRLYTPYGPVAKDLESLAAALDSLRSLGKSRKCTFIRIEPTLVGPTAKDMRKLGLKPVTYQQLNPHHTRIINLDASEDELLANMAQSSRNITRNYAKKGITIASSYEPEDIDILINLLKKVGIRNAINVHSGKYYTTQAQSLLLSKNAALYVAKLDDDTPLAAALVYDSPTTRYYAHAAANDEYRKLQAGTALVGQMILDAKRKGLREFDLYGTTPSEEKTHPWYGFTKFKKSFGGESREYVGAWDLPLNPLGYYSYRAYQAVRKKLK